MGRQMVPSFFQITLQVNAKVLTYIAKAIPEFIKELGVFM